MRAAVLLLLLASCSRNDAPASAPDAAPVVARPPPSAAPAAAPKGPQLFEGMYTAAPATLTRPEGAPAWNGEDAGIGLGEGKLSLSLDPASGRVTGTADGPLGPATVSGQLTEGRTLSFSLLRTTKDGGFTGTGYGTLEGAAASGTLRASASGVFREAKFTLHGK